LETLSMCLHTELAYPVQEKPAETVKRTTLWWQSRAVMDEEEEEERESARERARAPPPFRGGE
jgi:hypothetical protein